MFALNALMMCCVVMGQRSPADQPTTLRPDQLEWRVAYTDVYGNVTSVQYLSIYDKMGQQLAKMGLATAVPKEERAIPVSNVEPEPRSATQERYQAEIRDNSALQKLAQLRDMGFGQHQRPYDRSYGMYGGGYSRNTLADLEILRLAAERQSMLEVSILMAEQERARIREASALKSSLPEQIPVAPPSKQLNTKPTRPEPPPRIEADDLRSDSLSTPTPVQAQRLLALGSQNARGEVASAVAVLRKARALVLGQRAVAPPTAAVALVAPLPAESPTTAISARTSFAFDAAESAEPVSQVEIEPVAVKPKKAARQPAKRYTTLSDYMSKHGY